MALIKSFFKITKDRQALRSEVDCGFSVATIGGRRILQLETYGSSERKIEGKTSQNIQLDEKAARQLLAVIRDAFPTI